MIVCCRAAAKSAVTIKRESPRRKGRRAAGDGGDLNQSEWRDSGWLEASPALSRRNNKNREETMAVSCRPSWALPATTAILGLVGNAAARVATWSGGAGTPMPPPLSAGQSLAKH